MEHQKAKMGGAVASRSHAAGAPTQSRSLASLKRMIAAARGFMLERGNEEFTLQEVSRVGKVSIGSIYHRFASKEELVRAVIAAELKLIADEETDVIGKVLASSGTLAEYVPHYVAGYAAILRKHSLMLRLAMQRASFDAQVSGSGDRRALEAATEAINAVLSFRSEISGDATTKSRMIFQTIFATIARHLSLDSRDQLAMQEDWQLLMQELSCMALSYLISPRPATKSAAHRSATMPQRAKKTRGSSHVAD